MHDDFAAHGERTWTKAEQRQLLAHYECVLSVRQIAVAMNLDQKDIAAKLIRLLLDPAGRIDNDDEMTRAGMKYTETEHQRLRHAYAHGVPLATLAIELGRSQLGVGWRMLDQRIPEVPARLRSRR